MLQLLSAVNWDQQEEVKWRQQNRLHWQVSGEDMCAWQVGNYEWMGKLSYAYVRNKSSSAIGEVRRIIDRLAVWLRTENQNKSHFPTFVVHYSERGENDFAAPKARVAFWMTSTVLTAQNPRRKFTFCSTACEESSLTLNANSFAFNQSRRLKGKWRLIREIWVSDETYFVIKSEFRTQNTRLFELHTTENKCTVLRKWKNLVKNRVHKTRRLKQG